MSPTALASLFFICQALSCVIHTYLIKSNDFFFYLKNKTKTSEGNSILIFRQGEVLGCDVVQNSTGNTGVRKNWSEINNWYGLFSLNLLFFFNFMSNFLTYPSNYELEQNKSCGTMEDWLRKAEGEKWNSCCVVTAYKYTVCTPVRAHTHAHTLQTDVGSEEERGLL